MTESTAHWQVRHYREGDEVAILALFNSVFEVGNPDFEPRTLRHWNWAFRDNPCGHQTMVAESVDDGHLVGMYTAMPALWRFPHGRALGGQAVDSCVAAEYRRSLKKSGLFLTMGGQWFDHWACPERDNIVYGFPNPQAFRIGTRRLDYRPVRCPMPERSLPVRAALDLPATTLRVEEVTSFGREVDALDEALAKGLGISCVRDARYLNWRYTDCVTTDYRILRAESRAGELRGFLVYTLGWHGDRKDVAPLVDWLIAPGDLETWQAFLPVVAGQAAGARLNHFLAWTPPLHPVHQDLSALGFDVADSRFNLCIRIFVDSFEVEDAIRDWYVVMGDSDIY